MGSHLVTMETTEEWKQVKSYIADKVAKDGRYTHWYIGLRKKSGTWKWTEAGSPGVVVATDDSRWQPGEPSQTPKLEDCGEINSYEKSVYGRFNNIRCDVKYQAQKTDFKGDPLPPRGYICEKL